MIRWAKDVLAQLKDIKHSLEEIKSSLEEIKRVSKKINGTITDDNHRGRLSIRTGDWND